jgi:hypothetical protein
MLTATTLIACFVCGMRYNTGFKKKMASAGHILCVNGVHPRPGTQIYVGSER